MLCICRSFRFVDTGRLLEVDDDYDGDLEASRRICFSVLESMKAKGIQLSPVLV